MLETEVSQTQIGYPNSMELEAKIYMACGFLACTGKAEVGVARVGVASMALTRHVSFIFSHTPWVRGLSRPF